MANRLPDDATPDDATPDDADQSSSSSSSSKKSPPPPSSNKSPSPPPPSSNKSPPPPSSTQSSSNKSPPPPPSSSSSSSSSSNQASSHKSPSPPSSTQSSSRISPPPPASGETSPTNENNDNNDMTRIGVGVGVGIFLLLLICVCVICSRRKKNKQKYYYSADPSQGTDYLFATPHRGNTSQYGSYHHHSGQHPHPNWQSGPGPGPYGGPPSGVWSGPHPLNSGEMSNNYSLGMGPPPPPPGLPLNLMGGSGTFTYEELAAATGGFANENIIGQGGFGFVHKGVLASGKEVAVKGLKAGSGQGEREFQAEIEIISRVHHRHLVTLVGYCIAGGQRMLVYEFVPNNTLEHHLHGKGVPTMDWATRMKIAIGSAKGLAYLHEDCSPRIIHRDIKASNVLIDNSFEAKVADFGLAKLTTDTNTHVSTRVMGTFGYLAPEYAASGKLSEKSDVFSFGVMLLELITGKRPIDLTNTMDESLVDWARPLLSQALEEDGNFGELVDPFLEGNYNPLEMAKMAACASASIRHSARKRPKMSQIVKILDGDVSLDDLKEAMLKPSGQSSSYSSTTVGGSDQYDTKQYNADMIKFRQAIMSSQEFGNTS